MPRCCNVYGCKSNYKSQKKSISVFALPKDHKLREQWIQSIPNSLEGIKNPMVCIKHFHEEDIIRVDRCIVKKEVKEFERKIPKLKSDAVPTIFIKAPEYSNLHSGRLKKDIFRIEEVIIKTEVNDEFEYDEMPQIASDTEPTALVSNEPEDLSIGRPKKRPSDAETETAVQKNLKTSAGHKKTKQFTNLEDISVYYEDKIDKRWSLFQTEDKLILYYLNFTKVVPCITFSIVIDKDLKFYINYKQDTIPLSNFCEVSQVMNSADVLGNVCKFAEQMINEGTP